MSRTRLASLALVALVTLGGGWLLLWLLDTRGVHLPPVPWAVCAAIAVASVAVLIGGIVVRAYLHGKRPSLAGLRAAQLTMLGKAAAYAGAVLAGWYAAQALFVLPMLEFEPQRARLAPALAALAAAVVLTVAGLLTERAGQLPPPTDDLTLEGDVRHHGAHD